METLAQAAAAEAQRKLEALEQAQRATLNILEDFSAEKSRLEQGQRATLNILEDFDSERQRLEAGQRATLNILEDFNADKSTLHQNQRAMLNLLEDFEAEKTKVEAASQSLELVNKELEGFSYSVAHDLRAPLRHVDGFSKILLDDYGPAMTEEGRRLLERVRDGAQRMGTLIDELLGFSRMGRRELQRQITGLNSLAEEVRAGLKAEADGRSVEWRVAQLPYADCDPALIKQVFSNLLGNALKYSRPRERAVIEVGQLVDNGQTTIFVRDNGVGFDMKYADKLFGVFQRLHRPEDFEGTGVGLALVQKIIHKHGGRVWAEAQLDRGATFYFTLGTAESPPQPSNGATGGTHGREGQGN
jgi:light-regulated signal transduction histidine kinase (bacteriophytochrome)